MIALQPSAPASSGWRPTSDSVQLLYLVLIPTALLVNTKVSGLPVATGFAGGALLYAAMLVSTDSRSVRPLVPFVVVPALVWLALIVGGIASGNVAGLSISRALTKNMLLYTFPAILLSPFPRPRVVAFVSMIGIAGSGVFLLGPGLGNLATSASAAVVNSDFGQLNFGVFRTAAEYWNDRLGQQAFPNPGSVKNTLGELSVTLFFLVLATRGWRRSWSQGPLLAALGLLTVITQSRSAWISLLLPLLIALAVRRRSKGRAGLPLAHVLLALAVVPVLATLTPLALARLADDGTNSYASRQELLSFYWGEFLGHPLTGSAAIHPSGLPAHMVPIDWAARFGLLGLVAGVLLCALLGRLVLLSLRRSVINGRWSDVGTLGLSIVPAVRLFTTGGANLSVIASLCLGMAIVSMQWSVRGDGLAEEA